jgi:AcrR family transcriptional regulator
MNTSSENLRVDVVAAALQIAADGGWRGASLGDIAEASGVPVDELRGDFPDKPSILAAFIADIDEEVLSRNRRFEDEDTPRDRLFEILMGRFDALGPHRSAVGALFRDIARDPISLCMLGPTILGTSGPILDAAGISETGPFGCLRSKGLLAIWLATFKVWLEDDSPDLAPTMAALDRNLRHAESAVMGLDRLSPIGRRAAGG